MLKTKSIVMNIIEVCSIFFVLSFAIFLSGCAAPQVMIVKNNGNLDINKKVFVKLQAEQLTPIDHAEWRNDYLPSALKKNGINNFQIMSPGQDILQPEEIKDSYIIFLTVRNWTINTKGSCEMFWVPATVEIFKLPEKIEIKLLEGQSHDTHCFSFNLGEVVGLLFEDMLKKAYHN